MNISQTPAVLEQQPSTSTVDDTSSNKSQCDLRAKDDKRTTGKSLKGRQLVESEVEVSGGLNSIN